MQSFFEKVPLAPPDAILGLTLAFQNDPRPAKVNLGVGVFKTQELRTPVLSCVKSAEAALLDLEKTKEYLPIEGDALFIDQIGGLIFGDAFWDKENKRIAGFQTVGGTGALKVGGTFLKEEAERPVWLSTPTWTNHIGVFASCGMKIERYPYYKAFEKMIACLESLSEGSIVVMHASCHNPTGWDLNADQWKTLLPLFKRKRLIPFFDCAYQGFGRGLDEDAAAIRLFAREGLEMLVAVSNAKNFGLYGERVGALYIVAETAVIAEHISSRVKQVIRAIYSNPPMHGAKIVAHILSTSSLRKTWEEELNAMRQRINSLRISLCDHLGEEYSHLKEGKGMFVYSGLHQSQVDRLKTEYGIYMPSDGRINVCGLNQDNLDYVVDAIKRVII